MVLGDTLLPQRVSVISSTRRTEDKQIIIKFRFRELEKWGRLCRV